MRRVSFTLILLVFLAESLAAVAQVAYPIVFPVDGSNRYIDSWGAARAGGRTHEGTDIIAARMTPVVAAADGVVGWMHNQRGGNCCAMELIHDDGYRSRYIHLNNDTPGSDDGQGWGFAPGIVQGARVRAGQLIGFVGDSGNAEWTSPHLHFELRTPDNVAFNSYPSLLAGRSPGLSTWHAAASSLPGLVPLSHPVGLYVDQTTGVVVPGDFDADGQSEVAVGGGLTPGWMVAELGGESGRWSTADGAGYVETLAGDFDGDGDDDLASFSPSRAWTGFRSNGSGFALQNWGKFGGAPWQQRLVGDFDGDGDDDILSLHPPSKTWWLSRLQGSKLVTRKFATYGSVSGWQTHVAADLNGDGADELVSFHPANGTWWSTGASGQTRLVIDVSTNKGWQFLTPVDPDADGDVELAMYHPSNGTWWLVDASSSPARLTLWARFSTRTGWVSPVASDINDDSKEDLLIRHQASGRVWALMGGGGGSLRNLGSLVAGSTQGEWLTAMDSGPGLLALTTDQ